MLLEAVSTGLSIVSGNVRLIFSFSDMGFVPSRLEGEGGEKKEGACQTASTLYHSK
jgi:hypothetical protein